MEIGDGKISLDPGIIRTAEYSYLLDSKTFLFVHRPSRTQNRGLTAFFTGLFLVVGVSTFLAGENIVWVWVSFFLFAVSAFNLVRSVLPRSLAKDEWTLMVGSGETPMELFKSMDQQEFETKRTEIEQALLTRQT